MPFSKFWDLWKFLTPGSAFTFNLRLRSLKFLSLCNVFCRGTIQIVRLPIINTNLYLHTADFIQINEHALFILKEWEHIFPIFLRFFARFHDGLNCSVPIMSLQDGNESRVS